MSTASDTAQLELIVRSLVEPAAEEEAKRLLLREIYRSVSQHYRERAPNGGLLAPLPECVKEFAEGKAGEPCSDDMGFTYNALRVLFSRYLTRDAYGRSIETPSMVMMRVALGFGKRVNPGRLYELIISRRFMFNSPTLFNMYADGARGTLSACYVTPVYDDMKAIMDAATVQAMTFKWGGGQGFSFSELRPRWDVVKGTSGYASGPISFMRIYDMVTEMVKQGGKRRGANMGIMHAWHPDIYNPYFNPWHALRNLLPPQVRALISQVKKLVEFLEEEGYEVDHVFRETVLRLSEEGWETVEDAGFIQAKEPPLHDANMTNFNISVAANDAFMEAVLRDEEWWMVNPRYSVDPGSGVYRLHYTVSRATGLGRVGELVKRHPWLLENPYLNLYEDVLEEAKEKALRDASEAGYKPDQKNPYAWRTSARRIWEKIVENAWAGGDPGLFYVDNHNKWSPTPWLGAINATNPCVSGDTRVLTPEGWKTAREIWEEAKRRGGPVKAVLVDEEALGEGGEPVAYETSLVIPAGEATVYKTAHGRELMLSAVLTGEAWVWHVGKKPAVKVVTREGYEAVVTHEHRLLTPQGWKEARDLKPGDKIAVARLHPAYVVKSLASAAKLDRDVAFALGWLIGDGTLNEHYVAWYFGPGDEAALERVKQAVAKLGGNPEANLRLRGKEWTLQFNVGTTVYKKMTEILGGTLPRQPERRLPEIAWRLDPESLAEFLRGLFTADGTVDADAAVRLTSSSLRLLKDVQVLLTTLGIYSRIYARPYRSTFRYTTVDGEERVYEAKGYYELVISGYSRRMFAELVGFESASKTAKLRLAKTKMDHVWATVERVEEAGIVDFYDFTVPGHHKYIAAGLVHHNCGEQPLYPFESCNLGSVSLEKYVVGGRFDVEKFMQDIQDVVDAMDAVIDLNNHPDERQDEANKFTRKIGLGVMGLADALAKLGYPYDSDEAVAFTLIAMAALEVYAWKRSWELGAKLGHAPAFGCKRYDWKRMECVGEGEPEELLDLHTPALVKAGLVARFEDGWVKVRYHAVSMPDSVLERITGVARERVESDGSLRLVREEVLERVAREVFGVTRETAWEALRLHPVKAVNSPRHLLALAVWVPHAAWEILRVYGRLLGARAPRNTVVTTVAPTGTISIIAGTSSGIEPYFALVYKRRVTVGEFLEVVREFRSRLLEAAEKYGVPEDAIRVVYETISRYKGSLRWALEELRDRLIQMGIMDGFLAEVERLARLFTMSMDFDVWYHLAHQVAAQLYVDQAISKTINLRREAGRDEVYTAYLLAWLGGLKGVTVYRDESKGTQVIYFGCEQKQLDKAPIRGRKSKTMRMTHLKRKLRREEASRDEKLAKLFETKESNDGEVVVELTENSSCTTCDL